MELFSIITRNYSKNSFIYTHRTPNTLCATIPGLLITTHVKYIHYFFLSQFFIETQAFANFFH